jgi:hypothetical protein
LVKRVGKLVICLAGGLVLNASLRAEAGVSSDNPYAPIVTRNVFGINPPPPVDPNQVKTEPPPKITPNGIMSIFGHLQVLFKVSIPAKPGQPAKDQFYILSEGQGQDDIEVTKIDEKASLVTFNNHGTVQELPLATAPAPTASAPAQAVPGPVPIRGPFAHKGNSGTAGGSVPAGNPFGQVGSAGGQNPNINRGNNFNSGVNTGVNLGTRFGAVSAGGGSSPSQNTMTPEMQMIMIAAQHARAQQEGDPAAPIYPPTPIDADAGVVPSDAPPPP